MEKLTVSWCSKNRISVDYGTHISDLINNFKDYIKEKEKISVVKFNNKPVSISSRVENSGDLTPIYHKSREGIRIYQKTLTFITVISWQRLFPSKKIEIGQSMEDGVYFSIKDNQPISNEELESLNKEIIQLIANKIEIKRIRVPYKDAYNYFEKEKRSTALALLDFRNEETVELYLCDGIMDLASGPLLANTGEIKLFELHWYYPGFMLRCPSNILSAQLDPFKDNKPLFNIHKEYRQWGKILNITCVGELNRIIESKGLREFIHVNEILQDNKIATIAKNISENRDRLRIILIAGPSSSGKTTFTKKLATHLQVFGFQPSIIGMDDYFLPKEQTPLDEKGDYDFESIKAIDTELLNKQLISLFSGNKIEVPIFDFKKGHRKEKGTPLQLKKGAILIMEGIHGLNEVLTTRIPREEKFLIYISALTQLKLDDHNRISTTDNRLLRRMVRDSQFRGQSACGTFGMWASVRRGEDKNIFPFQGNADIAFNSALTYEIPVLKVYADPLLRSIKPDEENYGEAVRLQEFLKNFLAIPPEDVPSHSILREFIGGSGFRY